MSPQRALAVGSIALAVAWAFLFGPMTGSSEAAYSVSSRYYENKSLGFKFRPIAGWPSFPAQPKDKVTVVRFRSDKADRGYVAEPNCYVGHLTKENETTIEDYLKGFFASHVTVSLKPGKFMPSSKLPPGSSQFNLGLAAGGARAEGMAVEYKRKDDSIVVIYYCATREFKKKYMRVFTFSLASFKFTSTAVKEDDSGGSLNTGKKGGKKAIDVRYEAIKKQGVPPGWNVVKIPYYIIYYNCDNEDLYSVINRLKIIRPAYHKYFPPMNKDFVDNA
ncbi:MAG: hypothetical protein ACYTFG_20210, partial [Planctomycetota bacterium]